uniref:Uncharacterized protein n=1 Tax=Mycena chlorophos TaxID=658473 RepID=A0ABQ0L290_MYCCL|nr:predicted protein [Mycena chlorophos]
MAPHRRRYTCVYDIPAPKPRVNRPKPVLTPEERVAAKEKRAANKVIREARKVWEATLVPWVPGATAFRHKEGTHVMFKTDALKLFSLTEKEIATLPREVASAAWGDKHFFALKSVRELHQRKLAAGAHPRPEEDLGKSRLIVLEANKSTGRATRKNFDYIQVTLDPRYPLSTTTSTFTLDQYDHYFAPAEIQKRAKNRVEERNRIQAEKAKLPSSV